MEDQEAAALAVDHAEADLEEAEAEASAEDTDREDSITDPRTIISTDHFLVFIDPSSDLDMVADALAV